MNRTEIAEQVIDIIADTLNVSKPEVTEEKTLQDLNCDSLDSVEVLMEIEKKFNIAIADHEMEKFTNIHSIIDYVNNHTK